MSKNNFNNDKSEYMRRKQLLVDFMGDKKYSPMKIKELAIILQVEKEDRPMLEALLDELLDEGTIELSKRGKYSLATEKKYTGVFTGHPDGFGFVKVEGRAEDLYIPEDMTGTALHGDTVEIILIPGKRGKRQEAYVNKVVERSDTVIVGVYEKEAGKGYGFVVPDNRKIFKDIFVDAKNALDAKNGEKVCVEIVSYPEKKNPEGMITQCLGMPDEVGVDILSIIKTAGFSECFPDEVLGAAKAVAVPVSDEEIDRRLDLRDELMVTIDGEDAKDLDDAVSLHTEGELYVLGVHIADVTHYVKENGILDKEALHRGTSVYLADRVLPMLPTDLSNGCCSLNAGENRLALSCIMKINKKGTVVDSKLEKTVIKVDRRMSYTEVKNILEGTDEALIKECDRFVPMFKEMAELAALLRQNRFKKGSIDFDFPETKVILDSEGHPVSLVPHERNVATKLIEEFMLQANRCVAETMYWLEMPFVYRIHETPDMDKIKELSVFVSNFGYSLRIGGDEVHPGEIQKLLAAVEGTPREALISRITLRAMKKAKYSDECLGHFGLSFDYYTHFTSPIRRYPDLQIHRIIKEYLDGELNENRIAHYREILWNVAKKSSDREVAAAEAERESVKLKKAEYMLSKIGEEFDGVISGVTAYGLYVELENTVEGFVHVSKIPGDFYRYSERDYAMYGETTSKSFALGQKVRVQVAEVNLKLRTIDFVLIQEKQL